MRVSFDLDDTLILKTAGGHDESLPAFKPDSVQERLRPGTKELMLALVEKGCDLWIYSNSYRGKQDLLRWFARCGIPIANVINQQLHEQKCAEAGCSPMHPGKHPRLFGIDLHIDDSLEVENDGRLHGFKVIRVSPDDSAWASVVIAGVEAFLRQ